VWEEFVGISRDYTLQTRPSKQPIEDFPRYKIPSHPLKYTRSKQGFKTLHHGRVFFSRVFVGIREYCVNIKFPFIPTSSEENIREVNKT
jgi:hypothetical protein